MLALLQRVPAVPLPDDDEGQVQVGGWVDSFLVSRRSPKPSGSVPLA